MTFRYALIRKAADPRPSTKQRGRQNAEWRRQRADKLRDVQAELYLDLTSYLNDLDSSLNGEVNILHHHEPLPGLAHTGQLSARVDLYASDSVRDAWGAVQRASALAAHDRDGPAFLGAVL
jgi:hypothetical protein